MKIFTRSLLVLTILLNAQMKSNAQNFDPIIAASLQHKLDSLCIVHQVKGISAAAFIPGQGMWKGVTGISYGTVLIDTNMLFSIGSVTKTFVAAEVFRLIDNGQLNLDDSLYTLISEHNNVDSNITVRQLLGHTSGLGDVTNANWQAGMNADLYRIWYLPQVIDSFIDPPAGVPGTSWNYCNTNYLLLGEIIEAKRNDSLHKVLRNDFLSPYQLSNTHMEIFETYSNTIAHNWSAPNLNPALASDESSVPHQALWSSVEAAGGYFSDAADLAKWGYNLYSGNVISQSSMNEMLTITPLNASYFNGYGLGIMRFPYSGRTFFGHAGNYFGYAASMIYYPEDSICVALLVNQDCISPDIALPLINSIVEDLVLSSPETNNENNILVSYSNDELKIKLILKENASLVQLFDLSGRKIITENIANNSPVTNTSQLKSGIYFIRIGNGSGKKIALIK